MEPLKLSTGVLLVILRALLITGVSALSTEERYVKAGEMEVLHCGESYHNDADTHWHRDTSHEFNNMSAAELRQMGVVVHGNSLVILSASVNHQGNYSCSLVNSGNQSRFTLTVYTAQSREYKEGEQYPIICYVQKSCQLNCPSVNIPLVNITSSGTTWHKEDGGGRPCPDYISAVEKKDSGNYTCTTSYVYDGQIYNLTRRVVLEVHPDTCEHFIRATINSPRENEVFEVELGSQKEIVCEAVTCSCTDSPFWLSGGDFVEMNDNFLERTACNESGNVARITVTLVIQKVTEDDLLQNYTCKLESIQQHSSSVTISLTRKARPSYVSLVVCIICCMAVTGVAVVVYVKFKVDITLFLRDTLCWQGSASDGKSYDAFLMSYESSGLGTQDRKWLESVLEDRFGYTLCIYDRDVLPGNPVAEAVLNCIEQSRTVVLVPSSPGPDPGSGLLSAIHAALVERQTRLVFINTEPSDVSRSGSLPEALQLLSEAGDHVTWKGMKSMHPSSSFWKRLRYYLPAPQQPTKMKLLPQTVPDVTTQ